MTTITTKEDPKQEGLFTTLTETLVKRGKTMKIETEEQLLQADSLFQLAHSKIKEVTAYWNPIVDPLGKAHKAATGKRKAMLEPLEDLKKQVGELIAGYQSQKKLEAKKKEQEAAKKQAEIDARVKDQLEEEKNIKADALEKAGMKEEADAVRKEPVEFQTTMTFSSPTPKTKTQTTTREEPDPELIDIKLLAGAVAKGKIPANILQMNFTVAKNLAKTLKHIPGVLLKTKTIPVA